MDRAYWSTQMSEAENVIQAHIGSHASREAVCKTAVWLLICARLEMVTEQLQVMIDNQRRI